MKTRPILFSSAMVKAILDGRKSQTRRVIKPQPELFESHGATCMRWKDRINTPLVIASACLQPFCPYGGVGDHLWCRETWQRTTVGTEPRPLILYYFRADRNPEQLAAYTGTWRPSIFMPRAASRITLEITGVRVERVQDITPDDAEQEGIPNPCGYYCDVSVGHVDHQATVNDYAALWDSINGKTYPWSSNPWVWCISFRRVPS